MIDAQLLAAVRRRPDDDAPRLVYADYLEERGDLPRAQLIALQCRIAALPAWDREAADARREVDVLLCDHGDRWRAELPALDHVTYTTFSRGFVDTARVRDVAALYRHADAIGAVGTVSRVELELLDDRKLPLPDGGQPWLRTLRVRENARVLRDDRSLLGEVCEAEIGGARDYLAARGAPGDEVWQILDHVFRSHAARPTAHGLRELSIISGDRRFRSPRVGVDGAGRLAGLHLDHLSTLQLCHLQITSAGFAALVPTLPRLRELAARGNDVGELGWLTGAPGPPLARLDLGDNPIGDDGARAIAASPRLAELRSLSLDGCHLTGAGVAALVASPCWHELRELDLSRNPLTIEAERALAGAARPAHLHTLRLAGVRLTPAAAHVLAGAPWLDQLAAVDLSRNPISAELLAALVHVADLRLADCDQLDPAAAEALEASSRLWRLDLHGTPFGAGARLPAVAPALYRLELGGCPVDHETMKQLAAGDYPRLRRLELGEAPVEDRVAARLLASPLADQLAVLGLARTHLSATSLERLALARMSRLRVLDLSGIHADRLAALKLVEAEALRGVVVVLRNADWMVTVAEMGARFGPSWLRTARSAVDAEYEGEDDGPRR